MSFFDFFFPEQAQATHLRRIAERQRSAERRSDRAHRSRLQQADRSEALEKRIEELEGDLGFVALVLGAVMGHLDEKGTLDRDDLRKVISELDGLDGIKDGKLSIDVLRGMGS